MKFIFLSLLMVFLTVSYAGRTAPMSVGEKARLLGRLINGADSIPVYEPYRDQQTGHISIPLLVSDNFFNSSKYAVKKTEGILNLMRLYVLSDSAWYYTFISVYFLSYEHPDRSFKLDFNEAGMDYRKIVLSVDERYELLSGFLALAHWKVKDLSGNYEQRQLGFLLDDELVGIKLSDWQMDRYAVDLAEIMYDFVLSKKDEIVSHIPVYFNDSANDPNKHNAYVYYREFWIVDRHKGEAHAFS